MTLQVLYEPGRILSLLKRAYAKRMYQNTLYHQKITQAEKMLMSFKVGPKMREGNGYYMK